MYRAAALAFLEAEAAFEDEFTADVLGDRRVDLERSEDGLRVFLGGEDVTRKIRDSRVSAAASRVSALPSVRSQLVEEQRRVAQKWRELGGVVVEGRDIGTVVFPDAEVKVFLIADVEERAKRRFRELHDAGEDVSLDDVVADIRDRDSRDTERELSPLKKAEDAIEVDTTALTQEEQIQRVIEFIETRRNGVD